MEQLTTALVTLDFNLKVTFTNVQVLFLKYRAADITSVKRVVSVNLVKIQTVEIGQLIEHKETTG